MKGILNSSDVRNGFSEFVDSVVREKPQAFKRNRDLVMSMSKQHLQDLVASQKISVEYEKDTEDGSFAGSLNEIPDIVGGGDNFENFIEDIALQLIDYSQLYYDDFNYYYNSPNRRSHLPIVMNVLIQDDIEKVKQIIRRG